MAIARDRAVGSARFPRKLRRLADTLRDIRPGRLGGCAVLGMHETHANGGAISRASSAEVHDDDNTREFRARKVWNARAFLLTSDF